MTIHRVQIGERTVGHGHPCYLIAEAGVNHNGSLDLAMQLVDAAAAANADAVKFQTFAADRLASAAAPKAACQLRTTDPEETQREMLASLQLSADAHRSLRDRCHALGIEFLSSPFDEESADFLEQMGLAAYKIPSGELTNLPFLAHVARKGKPLIVSTGMSSLGDVETAVETIESAGNRQLVLLHCVSDYPATPSRANLRAMDTLAHAFGAPVGYSDHTEGLTIALAAAALGASVIEKHFTLDRSMRGPDHTTSLDSQDLAALVREVRSIESSLGDGRKTVTPGEMETALAVRKSLVARVGIPAGVTITESMLTVKRPGTGLSPTLRRQVLGRTARTDIAEDSLITLEMLA